MLQCEKCGLARTKLRQEVQDCHTFILSRRSRELRRWLICSCSFAISRMISVSGPGNSACSKSGRILPVSSTVRPGTPTTVAPAGAALMTTLPAPILALFSTRIGPRSIAPAPMTPLLSILGWRFFFSRDHYRASSRVQITCCFAPFRRMVSVTLSPNCRFSSNRIRSAVEWSV